MSTLSTPEPTRHESPTARATRLAHLIFERPDLERAEQFLVDFGLRATGPEGSTRYLRGSGPAPYCYRVERADVARFVGLGLTVSTREELEALAALPGAGPVEPSPHPGGGTCLQLRDPSGFLVEVLHGQQPAEELPHRAPLPLNNGGEQRRIDAAQRPALAPPEVLRLGHVVLEVADFQRTCGWYTQHFGLLPSDVQVLPDGSPGVVFLRLDLGDTPADHHTLALAQSFMPAYSHSAYEVVDADAVGMGQRVLRERGFRHAWGIGRHILGSQIFDYWHDAWGDKHEHYCDGDLFTSARPMGVHALSRQGMSCWGQTMPASFTRPRLSVSALRGLVTGLRNSPDVSLQKLLTLARLFA